MIKFVVDDKIPFLKGVLEDVAGVRYLPGGRISPGNAASADGLIIRTRTKCNRALLEGSSVRFIASATIGYDHIDTDFCESRNIYWTNAPGCNASSVQQYVASALLVLAVGNGFRLADKTLGIIGVGNVGKKIAEFAQTVGMPYLLNDPPRDRTEGEGGFVSLDQLLCEADIITMHVPLNRDGIDRTLGLVDDDFLCRVRKGAFLINSSRGEVVCGNALKQALRSGRIAEAVLDVWEGEPGIDRELLDMVAYGTPHIAGYSLDGKANGTSMSVQAASRVFELGLDDWFPKTIPVPERTAFEIDISSRSLEDILCQAVCAGYNIKEDARRLRDSPETFEKQRGEYPLRREFPVYKITLTGTNPGIGEQAAEILKALGFTVVL